jgi:acetaldehyde dehydrogenase (acetylating)
MQKVKVGIIGSGNIGTDLLLKLLRSPILQPQIEVGVDEASEGLRMAREKGVKTSAKGIDELLKENDVRIVFDASGAKPHRQHAPLLQKAGKIAIDLTPAAVGPYVVPCINLKEHLNAPNVNLITCGAQATVPIVWAIHQVASVRYAEIISAVASKSAGIGTRQNIDEFTQTTARSLENLGGAKKGKAIIVLNPAEPPITMQNTVYTLVEKPDSQKIIEAVHQIITRIQAYVPGYRLKHEPAVDGDKVTVQIKVEGAGDYLPKSSGNLDIITSAAVAVAEEFARKLIQEGRA